MIGGAGVPILDLIIRQGEPRPQPGSTILCRHPFDESKRAYVKPATVVPLLRLVWKGAKAPNDGIVVVAGAARSGAAGGGGGAVADGAASSSSASSGTAQAAAGATAATTSSSGALPEGVNLRAAFPPLSRLREFVTHQLALLREDHVRPLNPTPYKVSVSPELYHYIHDLWMRDTPIPQLE